ncbi:nicotinate-nucleotide--dimethylbenzimidazole phosphoribosyltransferase [Kallotenue papyrolyticum]|uniref:nicotinate-nucleotide--dimethylbenzimidazole phosphoribosyltransferase n=1 Tax=Kallotenue papyrolyticum TaxID=1325125 RepID=UPI0004786799|nr:nicotinate-nucleotide--dimethylbenzimidazole phosphoribosyltransferase [Kallotenue papyrolyticum]
MSLDQTIATIDELDTAAMRAAAQRQTRLTKPLGALGRLEALSVQLAGIMATPRPRLRQPTLVVAAASHGVAAEGVSAYPATVTAQMVANFLTGGAAINVLADLVGARLVVVDAGVDPAPPEHPRLRRLRIANGTNNFRHTPAMTREQAQAIVEAGIALAQELVDQGADLLLLGEMGIGNTTSAAAITAAITGAPVERVTGRGTLIDDARLRLKQQVISEALALHRPAAADGLGVLSAVGGYEIGLLTGVTLGAAARRRAVLLDGYITTAAALIAVTLAPRVRDYLIAGHRSQEPGHALALEHLGLPPLLDLELRLGEGSGAALALPLVIGAARTLDEMATFDEAGVDDRTP